MSLVDVKDKERLELERIKDNLSGGKKNLRKKVCLNDAIKHVLEENKQLKRENERLKED